MTEQIKNTIYTPPQVSAYAVQHIRAMQSSTYRAVNLGIPYIEDYFAPMIPGQLCAIIAQTSQYKSGFLHYWEHLLATQLIREKREKEIVIHVSVEEGVEEQAFLEYGRLANEPVGSLARGQVQDWDRLIKASAQIGSIPIYRLGDSIARADDMPNLYLSNMIKSIEYLQNELLEWKPQIAAIFFDYLQAFPIDPEVSKTAFEQQRRLQVRNDIFRLRQAAGKFNCPAIVAVQAKQKLDGAPGPNMLIPGIYDGEESSSIGQRSDRIVQLWLPKMTHAMGSVIEHKNAAFTVDENLIFVKIGKQRGGLPSGKVFRCRVDYNRNVIAPERQDGTVRWPDMEA